MVNLNSTVAVRDDEGVLVDVEWSRSGVTEQFIENAEVYHERYANDEHWRWLLRQGLSAAKIDCLQPLEVLDIGSGSGNSFFAAMHLLPHANIVASDISPALLKILLRVAEPIGARRPSAYCFDLHKDFFTKETFDIAIGGAILHHMLDPKAVLANVISWCKAGGKIIMFEPMEASAHFNSIVYHKLIDELDGEADPTLIEHFRAMILAYNARFGFPNEKPWTKQLDDKLFFTHDALRTIGRDLGFTVDTVEPMLANTSASIEQAIMANIRLSGNAHLPIPARLPQILNYLDASVSDALKRELASKAAIVLRRV